MKATLRFLVQHLNLTDISDLHVSVYSQTQEIVAFKVFFPVSVPCRLRQLPTGEPTQNGRLTEQIKRDTMEESGVSGQNVTTVFQCKTIAGDLLTLYINNMFFFTIQCDMFLLNWFLFQKF